ncbi:MAG: type II toxin-antitoxin system RelE/ParE family toxin [Planctomycetes bacterium]|nr:type II toxin-antitoxin system RelE/ParE family toxin [Planctomycetota bacterium]
MKYQLTPRAKLGLSSIILDVEERFGPQIADRVLEELLSTFERLSNHPASGHLREDLTDSPEIRFQAVGPTLIAYRLRGFTVQILFVERGERNWKRLL